MNIDLAQEFLQGLYETHIPNKWGDCSGEHEVSGYEYDLPSAPCELHRNSARVLGLPIVEWTKPPAKPLTDEDRERIRSDPFYSAYEKILMDMLKGHTLINSLSKKK